MNTINKTSQALTLSKTLGQDFFNNFNNILYNISQNKIQSTRFEYFFQDYPI